MAASSEDKRTVTCERDKAILWLNDRIGRHVIVTCGYDVGFDAWIVGFEGRLRHWSADWQGTAVLAVPRDDVLGWFKVDDATLDVTHLPVVYQITRSEVRFDLAHGVTVRVTSTPW